MLKIQGCLGRLLPSSPPMNQQPCNRDARGVWKKRGAKRIALLPNDLTTDAAGRSICRPRCGGAVDQHWASGRTGQTPGGRKSRGASRMLRGAAGSASGRRASRSVSWGGGASGAAGATLGQQGRSASGREKQLRRERIMLAKERPSFYAGLFTAGPVQHPQCGPPVKIIYTAGP